MVVKTTLEKEQISISSLTREQQGTNFPLPLPAN